MFFFSFVGNISLEKETAVGCILMGLRRRFPFAVLPELLLYGE